MKPNPTALNKFKNKISWDSLDKELLSKHLQICIEEDLGKNFDRQRFSDLDITTKNCQLEGKGSAELVTREPMIICGLQLIPLIIEEFKDGTVVFHANFQDGEFVEPNQTIGKLVGPENEILIIERCALNFLQRLSGIATKANEFVSKIEDHGVGLLDTRKTTPGLRLLEKYASACGGCYNHRMGLFDRILIKDNHLAAAGVTEGYGLEKFLCDIVSKNIGNLLIEIEIDKISQISPAIESGVDAILLDNFTPAEINQTVREVKNKVVIEASGGITEKNILEYAKTRPHFISTGAPIHSSRWLDIGLDWM